MMYVRSDKRFLLIL